MAGVGPLSSPAAKAEPQRFPIECRLAGGPWRPCVMTVEEVGERWRLEISGEQLDFRHDGKGTVQMLREPGQWRTVSSNWEADQALCWDGVCAKGRFPLD